MFEEIKNEVKKKRGLTKMFLDYDGTLVDLTSQPELAIPDKKLLNLLDWLKREITLYLVTGRDLEGLTSLVGKGFNIIAMHGAEFISESGNKWSVDNFEDYQRRTSELSLKYSYLEEDFPGLRIIDKKGNLQFHYYNVDRSNYGKLERVMSGVKEEGFEMYSGKYVFELRVGGMDKGKAMLMHIDEGDFILYAGDDRTDEEAFSELGNHVTIKVGEGETVAEFRLKSPTEMKSLLSDLLMNRREMFRTER